MGQPRLYVFLGAGGSGRRAAVADLIAHGIDDDARPFVLISAGEEPVGAEDARALEGLEGVPSGRWTIDEAGSLAATFPDDASDVFFVTDGRGNPVDQIEALHGWIPRSGAELARIMTVVNCQLAHSHPGVVRWYEACIHFSDVVLLARREGVPNKWISEFTNKLRKEHYPCLVEMVKKDGVANPALLLDPQARRISMLFDEADEWTDVGDGEEDAGDDGEDLIGKVDPFLERIASGRRAQEIPDIVRFLPPKAGSA